MFTKSKKTGMCTCCSITNLVIAVLAVIIALIAVVGAYKAHMLTNGLTFGTTSGSMSLIALIFALSLIRKALKNCPCQCNLPTKK